MGFEMFDAKGMVGGRQPREAARIHAGSDRLTINKVAMRMIGNPSHAVFLFDPQRHCFAVRAATCTDPTSAAYRITKDGQVQSRAFMERYRIKRGDYDATLEGGMLVAHLPTPGEVQ